FSASARLRARINATEDRTANPTTPITTAASTTRDGSIASRRDSVAATAGLSEASAARSASAGPAARIAPLLSPCRRMQRPPAHPHSRESVRIAGGPGASRESPYSNVWRNRVGSARDQKTAAASGRRAKESPANLVNFQYR